MDKTESKELAILLDSLLSKYNRETRHLEFKKQLSGCQHSWGVHIFIIQWGGIG